MMKIRMFIGICLLVLLTSICTAEEKLPVGIVLEKPDEGPSVKTEVGYMVPYETVIPGTDVKYKMIPVAGGVATIGSPEMEADRQDQEGPQFEVEISPFWIGQYLSLIHI